MEVRCLAKVCVYSLRDAALTEYDAQSSCSCRLSCRKGKDSAEHFSGRRMKSEEPEKQISWGRSWQNVIYRFQFSSPCTPCEWGKTDSLLDDTVSRRGTVKVCSFHFMLCFWTTVFFCSHTVCVPVCVLASLKQCLPTRADSGHTQHLWARTNNSRCFLGQGISS